MNRTAQLRRAVLATAVTLTAGACADEQLAPVPPQPGNAVVSLATPHEDDGAVLVTVTGPGLDDVQALSTGYHVLWRFASPDELRLIVVGNVAAGPLVRIRVGDVNRPEDYSGFVREVATRADAKRDDTSGYGVSFVFRRD